MYSQSIASGVKKKIINLCVSGDKITGAFAGIGAYIITYFARYVRMTSDILHFRRDCCEKKKEAWRKKKGSFYYSARRDRSIVQGRVLSLQKEVKVSKFSNLRKSFFYP